MESSVTSVAASLGAAFFIGRGYRELVMTKDGAKIKHPGKLC